MLVTGEIVVRLRLVPSLQEDIAARGGGGRFGGILSKLRNVVLVLSYHSLFWLCVFFLGEQ
jgi:hypothetical protein